MIQVTISGVEDLVAFVAIIRGESLDYQKIKQLTTELNKDSDNLIEAEKQQKEK